MFELNEILGSSALATGVKDDFVNMGSDEMKGLATSIASSYMVKASTPVEPDLYAQQFLAVYATALAKVKTSLYEVRTGLPFDSDNRKSFH